MFKSAQPFIYELEDFLEGVDFINFSRPRGDQFDTVKENHLGPVRLPHTFSHWTYKVTGGLAMIVDIQGWRLNVGQYLMTDPIVFSNEKD